MRAPGAISKRWYAVAGEGFAARAASKSCFRSTQCPSQSAVRESMNGPMYVSCTVNGGSESKGAMSRCEEVVVVVVVVVRGEIGV